MRRIRELFEKFHSMDGRVKVKTAAGVMALGAVIALLVGVLPVIASNDSQHSTVGIHPHVVSYGGGSGACASSLDGRGPSAAGNEFHVNNPMPGVTYPGPDGISITVSAAGDTFSFNSSGSMVVYDVVVNGGPKNTHYDYDDHPDLDGDLAPGTVTTDGNLHAPPKGSGYHNLSHINVCYDEPGLVLFVCDQAVTLTDPNKLFTIAEATIYTVEDENGAPLPCAKAGTFLIEPNDGGVTLDFGDETNVVTGRLDITKDFDNDGDLDPTDFLDVKYDGQTDVVNFVDVPWCNLHSPRASGEDLEFDDVLPSNQYPELPGDGHTACKVHVEETATGIQYNVIYFEFFDPSFK